MLIKYYIINFISFACLSDVNSYHYIINNLNYLSGEIKDIKIKEDNYF